MIVSTDVVSLPLASDMARGEASFILDAAKRVAEQLTFIANATSEAQARIRTTQFYIEDLERAGTIDNQAACEILRRLLPSDELK